MVLLPEVKPTVPASSDKTLRAAEVNRRYARMAISWFAVDPVQVERTLRAVHERINRGETVDFLDALADASILTTAQIDRLRMEDGPKPKGDDDGSGRRPTKLEPINGEPNGDPAQIGRYRILRRLGEGGMGAVFLAFDSQDNRQVAVKVLSSEQTSKSNILQRFQREGRHGALLVHPNIVATHDMGQDAETQLYYIVLEYVDGPSAHDLLERTGKLQVGDALHIILDIARALEHAHASQIIHRDIKPGNILLTASGLAKLSDLGLAKRRDDPTSITSASQGIGTPYYMPYEQAMNAKMADERSDIYEVAVRADATMQPLRLPVLAVLWPPTPALPGTFRAQVDVPAGLRVYDAFPASLRAMPGLTGGATRTYGAELPVVPAMIGFALAPADQPLVTLANVLDVSVLLAIAVLWTLMWRQFRREA